MSIKYHSNAESAENAWKAICAKNGLTDAANLGDFAPGGASEAELHDHRKTARRAINKITDTLKPGDYNNAVTDALLFAGNVVAVITQQFERQADAERFFGKKQNNKVLRNAVDFERHFANAKDSQEEPFTIGEYFRGVANLRTTPAVSNALSVGTDTQGGFSVPSRLMPGILSAMVPVSSLMQAGSGLVLLEEGAKTFTTAAVSSIPTAAWRSEAGTLATSDPTFRAVVATPRSLSFQFKISRELLADGQNIQEALYLAIAQSFARELDRAGLRGSGTAPEPRGVLNTVGIQSITNGANGAALAGYANIFSATSSILGADCPMPTAAIMSPRSLIKLGAMADTTGQPLQVPNMLGKVQLIGTSAIPNNLTVGTSTDCSEIYVGDFTNLFFAIRESVSVQMLNEVYAGTGEIGFACHLRADVVATYPSALSVITGVRA